MGRDVEDIIKDLVEASQVRDVGQMLVCESDCLETRTMCPRAQHLMPWGQHLMHTPSTKHLLYGVVM